jgi:anti-sigma factor RsiW
VEHVSGDDLESYAMRSLPAPETDRLEEHLLICSACQNRLESVEQYVVAMKAAAGKMMEEGKPLVDCKIPLALVESIRQPCTKDSSKWSDDLKPTTPLSGRPSTRAKTVPALAAIL